MSMRIPNIIFSLNEKIQGRSTLEYFEHLKKTQWYSGKELKELQFEKLKALLIYAHKNTEYYRETFDRVNFSPYAMNSFEDFQKVPILTKEDIRNRLDKFICKVEKRKLTRSVTSSSTGQPLIFYISSTRKSCDIACHLRLRDWWDIHIGDREAVLFGSGIYNAAQTGIKKIRDLLLNTHMLPIFRHFDSKAMREYIAFLRKYRPKHIFSYAHGIYMLAKYAKEQKLQLNDIGTKVIFVTAEVLHDFQRALIEEVFDCPVANEYGCKDGGFIAGECPNKSMHITADVIYLECIKNNRQVSPGEAGEAISTHLDSYGMPFIRYKSNDEVILADQKICGCGRQFPAIKKVIGRDTDYIITPKGDFLHAQALIFIFRELDSVNYFKIVQTGKDELVIYIVKNEKYNSGTEDFLKKKIGEVINEPVKIIFNYINNEEVPDKNKHRFVESKILKDYLTR